jgi:hypothetical protein
MIGTRSLGSLLILAPLFFSFVHWLVAQRCLFLLDRIGDIM